MKEIVTRSERKQILPDKLFFETTKACDRSKEAELKPRGLECQTAD